MSELCRGAGWRPLQPLALCLVTVSARGPSAQQSLAELHHLGRERPPQEQRPVPQRDGEVAPAAADGVHGGLGAPHGDLRTNKTIKTHHSLGQHIVISVYGSTSTVPSLDS